MLPKYGHRTPQNLSAIFRLARGARKWHEIQGCDLWDNFPKEVSQGWAISETVTYSHCYIHASAALLIFSFSKLPVTTFQSLLHCVLFPLFHFTSFELCTLSSHLIIPYITQSGQGSCSFLVPMEAKQRDEKESERKGIGWIRKGRSEKKDHKGTE